MKKTFSLRTRLSTIFAVNHSCRNASSAERRSLGFGTRTFFTKDLARVETPPQYSSSNSTSCALSSKKLPLNGWKPTKSEYTTTPRLHKSQRICTHQALASWRTFPKRAASAFDLAPPKGQPCRWTVWISRTTQS